MNHPTIEDAVTLAARVHRGQVDRAGQPYLLHVLRVMLALTDEAARIAGVLHDVVEDTPVTLDDLRGEGYSAEICEALDCLTRRAGESYDDFIARLAPNPLARRVKLADLEDNMNPRRTLPSGPDHAERLARYRKAHDQLAALEPALHVK